MTSARAQGSAQAAALPPELASELPGARWRGTGVMRFFGLHIYDARLWSAAPVAGDGADQPLALELIYARALVGEQIASRSLQEMARIGAISDEQSARWLQAMTRLFPDVRGGDRLTGVQRPGRAARFFLNGVLRGEVPDADFTRLFFGIWLSPRTSEPRLRAQLLGGAP
ncbi:MAG: hypothetical protein A3E25_21120 [Burkholderiales bacterium RIFCSPHIGHO2_12_FULL_69_20]|nr:MAG: hypothetical protein A3E25_21120 [Burkholderiales bacterium RIFCSPHIGHO2_12_FULL_69_20]